MKKLIQTLGQINWDFSDYSSVKFPLDINSISWYPATFPSPIPKFLIALLSDKDDVVFDPFGGKGTVAVEAVKQKRRFVYNDLNPFASDIAKNIASVLYGYCDDIEQIAMILQMDRKMLEPSKIRQCAEDTYDGKDETVIDRLYDQKFWYMLDQDGISRDVVYWYHKDTLREMLAIYHVIVGGQQDFAYHVRKFAFVAILKEVSSQRGHFTYVTDNCWPDMIRYYDAADAYCNMLERVSGAVKEFRQQFYAVNPNGNMQEVINQSFIHCGDARKLDWLGDESVDLVITSPPYLCAQDYVKTMRLVNLFFSEGNIKDIISQEIGARYRRRKKSEVVVQDFYNDMDQVIGELWRVLKENGFFCLILGQGKGRVTDGYDTVQAVIDIAVEKYGFEKIFQTTRRISYKMVRIGGVDNEEIVIFHKIRQEVAE